MEPSEGLNEMQLTKTGSISNLFAKSVDSILVKTAGLKEEQAAIPYEFDKALQAFLMNKSGNDYNEFETLYQKCKDIIVNDPDLIRPIEEGGLGNGLAEIYNKVTHKPHTGPSQTRQIRV